MAVWTGGLVAIIVAVIPAVFNTMNMETGGHLLTRTFQGYDRLVMGCAGVLAVAMLIRTALTRTSVTVPEAVTRGDLWGPGVMMTVAAVLILYVGPQTVRLQGAAFSAADPAAKRAAYESFFAYHQVARTLYLLNLVLGIVVLCRKVARWVR